MELYLDISNAIAMKTLSCISPLAGATTSPGIIITGKGPLGVMFPQLHRVMGGQGRLFAQIMATTAEGMVNSVRKLHSVIANIVVKVPVTTRGLAAIKILKSEGIPTLGATVYDTAQELLSALAGVECIAPYVDRIDAQGDNGIQTVTDLHQLLKAYAPQMRVLIVSLRTPRQALDCLLAGCESITLPLDVARQMIGYPAVDAVVAKLEQDWLGAFDRTSI